MRPIAIQPTIIPMTMRHSGKVFSSSEEETQGDQAGDGERLGLRHRSLDADQHAVALDQQRRVGDALGLVLEHAAGLVPEAVRALLPILDDFERATKSESSDKEYSKGMEMIYQRFYDSLKKLGLEPIVSTGQPFDPHVHHAVEMVETDEAADHTVLDEYQRGYNFKNRLLRPAMVGVAKGEPKPGRDDRGPSDSADDGDRREPPPLRIDTAE